MTKRQAKILTVICLILWGLSVGSCVANNVSGNKQTERAQAICKEHHGEWVFKGGNIWNYECIGDQP